MSYNPYSLEGKTILVTGASSGIGKITAVECAKLGASVIITARNEERLTNTYDSLDRSAGQNHQMVLADLSTDEGIALLISNLIHLDGVFSNIGIGIVTPIKFIKDEVLEKLFQVNTFSHVKLARDLFKKRILNKNASYVFTGSVGGTTLFNSGNTTYGMTKAALISFMKSCAVDFSSRGIRCNAICPGMIVTPLTSTDGAITDADQAKDIEKYYLLKRYGRPEEVAWAAAFLLSDASSFITGTTIFVDGGASVAH